MNVARAPPPCRYVPQVGRTAEALASYEKALALTQQEPERQFLQERIRMTERPQNFDEWKLVNVPSVPQIPVRFCEEIVSSGPLSDSQTLGLS